MCFTQAIGTCVDVCVGAQVNALLSAQVGGRVYAQVGQCVRECLPPSVKGCVVGCADACMRACVRACVRRCAARRGMCVRVTWFAAFFVRPTPFLLWLYGIMCAAEQRRATCRPARRFRKNVLFLKMQLFCCDCSRFYFCASFLHRLPRHPHSTSVLRMAFRVEVHRTSVFRSDLLSD